MESNTPGISHSKTKRPRIEPPSDDIFTVRNSFAPLANLNNDSDAMEDETPETPTLEKEKCPPLYIYNIANINKFLSELKTIDKIGKFSYRTTGEAIKLNMETIDGYRGATKVAPP